MILPALRKNCSSPSWPWCTPPPTSRAIGESDTSHSTAGSYSARTASRSRRAAARYTACTISTVACDIAVRYPSAFARCEGQGGLLGRDASGILPGMPNENVEILKAGFAGFETGQFFELLDPGIEWKSRPDLPDSSVYRGHAGVEQLLGRFSEVVDGIWFRAEEFPTPEQALAAAAMQE